ncbi:MAG: hypothetical protein ACOZAK_04405 [Patescibacteria group bacterium]
MINTISNPNTSSNTSFPMGNIPSDPVANIPSAEEKVEKKFSKDQKKKMPSKYILAGILLLILTIGGGISMYLINRSQDLRQQADVGDYTRPPAGGDCSGSSAAQCQGKNPGDSCGGDGTCRDLPNQIGNDGKVKCTCDTGSTNPTTVPTTAPTIEPTTAPTGEPTTSPTEEPTGEPTAEPTNSDDSGNDDDSDSSSESYSESNSSATVNISTNTTTTTSQPNLPSQLPQSGPEDWLKYLQIGLGALGAGALLLLFL